MIHEVITDTFVIPAVPQPDRNFYKLELSDFSEGASHAGWRMLLNWLRDRIGVGLDDEAEPGSLVWRCTLAKLVVMDGTPNSPGNRHQDGEFGGDWRLIVDLGDFLYSDHKDAPGRIITSGGGSVAGAAGGAASSSDLSTAAGVHPAVPSLSPAAGDRPEATVSSSGSSGSAASRWMHFYCIASGGPAAGKEARVVTPVVSTAATVLAMHGRAAGSPPRLSGTSRSPFVHERSGRGVSAVFDLSLCSSGNVGAL